MKKICLLGVLSVFFAMGLSISCGCRNVPEYPRLLRDFPQLFSSDTIIVYADNASDEEISAAETLQTKLAEINREKPGIKNAARVTAREYKNFNLIMIGIAGSNSAINEVLRVVHSSSVTAEYPGPNRCLLEIMTSIWNPGKSILIAAGSDETGLRSGILSLDGDGLKSASMEITDWTEVTGIIFPIDTEEEAIKYARLDPDVIAYIKGLTDSGFTTGTWASFDDVEKTWSVGIFAKNASDIWFEIHFRIDGTVIFKNKGVI